MNKFYIIALFAFLNFGNLNAQNPSLDWAKGMGGAGGEYGFATAVDAIGNVFTAGYFEGTVDFDPGPGVYNLTSNGLNDIFISKLDVSGNFLWAKNIGGTGVDFGYSITIDVAGNAYTTGFFEGTADFDPGPGIFNLTSNGGTDFFISKLDPLGNFVWARSIGGSGGDISYSINIDPAGDIYTTGLFNGTADFDPGPGIYMLSATGASDFFILKLNSSGNFIWAKKLGSSNPFYNSSVFNFSSVDFDAAGNIYTSGTFLGTGDFDPGPGVFNLTSSGGTEDFVTKLDPSGNFLWAKSMGGVNDDYNYCISVDPTGNVYTSGVFVGTADFDPGPGTYFLTAFCGSCQNMFISKLDPSGNFLWAKSIVGPLATQGNSIALDNNNNVYTTGYFGSTVDFDPGPGNYFLTSAGNYDAFVLKLDQSGNFLNAIRMGGLVGDECRSIFVDQNRNLYLAGYFGGTADFDPGPGTFNLTSAGNYDVFVVKLSQCTAPTIASFTPTSGPIGTTVTITGANFDPIPGNNIVFFGATRATVSAATTTSLTVTVPIGATYQFFTVINSCNLTAYSSRPFITTFPCGGVINAGSFAPLQDLELTLNPYSIASGDLDGDGKPDLAIGHFLDTVSILKNTSTIGNPSLASKIDFDLQVNTFAFAKVAVGDLDGDGKLDLAIVNFHNTVSVLRNTGTIGIVSFAPSLNFSLGPGRGSRDLSIGDLDGDGKPDLAITNMDSSKVSILRNTGTTGNISFASKVDFVTGSGSNSISLGDLDGDGKPDLVTTNGNSSTLSVLRNTSTNGIILFDPKIDFATGFAPFSVASGDLDGDGKPDLVTANFNSNTVSVLKNSSTSGTISFVPKVDFATANLPISVAIGDLDGDGKPDLAVTNTNNTPIGVVSVLKNMSIIGTISFAGKVDYSTGALTGEFAIGDLDGDGKPDFNLAIQNSPLKISTFRNIVATLVTPAVNITASLANICSGTSVTFTATPINGGATPAFQWQVNGSNVGTNSPIYTTSSLVNGDIVRVIMTSNAACALPTTATSNAITMTVTATVTPSVGIAASSTTICAGTSVIFTATPTNEGTTPAYQWQVNGGNVGTNSATYTSAILANGDIVRVIMTSNATCALPTTATSNAITMTVTATVTPSVGIAASSTTICAGTSVTFTATPTNGGTTPAYQWQVNGGNVGTNSATYTSAILANGDIVRVILTSNLSCASPTTANSNAITMTVTAAVIPSVNISASSTTICAGTSLTFTATPTNGGTTPAYQWQVNGGNVGISSPTYTSATLANGDIVRVILTSNAACATPTTATSNAITMTVTATVTPSVGISASATNICSGTSVTFTATPINGGTTPAFQWQLNGGNVGTNSATYTSATLANGSIVTVILTSNAACASPTTTISNAITMTVTSTVTPSVGISASSTNICAGTSVTFIATPTNSGTIPIYQWQVNGGNVGTNSPTYTTSTLSNGDVVQVIMTSNAPCATSASSNSNTITMTVSPGGPALVTITSTGSTICVGASVTFTATPTNGGTTPSYQWQANGINVGTNAPTFTTNTLVNGDVVKVIMASSLICATGSPVTSNSITMTVVPLGPATVNISSTFSAICSGTSVTFTATPTNGGTTPAYQWQVNGGNVGTNSPTFTTTTLANGDVVTVVMNSSLNCATGSPATSNSIAMTVTPSVTPSANITASSTAICVGASVTFTATPANGGATPVYQWKVNGANVGIDSSSYTTTSLVNGDVVTVIMTSNATCPSPATVTSGGITISVSTPIVPSVSITVPTTTICAGTSTTFTATPVNGGSAPIYQWQVNGANVGINSSLYTTSSLTNGDVVTAIVTSNAVCATVNVVTSNTITMTVINTTVIPSISIAVSPVTICYGTSVTIMATPINGGNSPSYQWKLNGQNTGTNTPILVNNSFKNGDIISCVMTSNAVCSSPPTVPSNDIRVVIDPVLCPLSFYMPTAFTPNNDGKNDECKPTLFGNVISYKFSIYNRWGQKIFETTDTQKGWDGKVLGLDTDSNIFIWMCNFQFQGRSIENRKGTVVLIR